MNQICEVIVDIAHANVDRLYSYLIPDGLQVFVGSHVLAPFGSGNRQREGFVIRVFTMEEFLKAQESANGDVPISLKP